MRNIALCGVAGGLLTLLATTCAADEINNAYEQCSRGQLAPGLYYLTPNEKRIDLPEKGSVTLPYNAQGKLLVVPELEDDEKEAAWGLTIRTVLERPDTKDEVNLSRTKVESTCDQTFPPTKKMDWNDENGTTVNVPFDDYEKNQRQRAYPSQRMLEWNFQARRNQKCASTHELRLRYSDASLVAVQGGKRRAVAVGRGVQQSSRLSKPVGQRLSSALVFRSSRFRGCHSMWVSKFGGTSSEKPIKSTVSVTALKSTPRTKHPSMSLIITWKVD